MVQNKLQTCWWKNKKQNIKYDNQKAFGLLQYLEIKKTFNLLTKKVFKQEM